MKFNISKEKFYSLIQKVLDIAPVRSTMPGLSNIVIEVHKDKIKMKATDLEISITSESEAETTGHGQLSVPGRILAELVRELPAGQVMVAMVDNRLELKSERGVFKLAGVPVDSLPRIPEFDFANEVTVPGGTICRMIKKCVFAVSKEESRPALNGVLWRGVDKVLTMVATNGHILAKMSCGGTGIKKLEKDIIVSPKVLEHFVKLYGDLEKDIGLLFSADSLVFHFEGTVLATRLIDPPYPNFEQVIPKENDKKAMFDRDDFYSLLRRVAIVSNNITHQVKLGFSPNSLSVSAANFDVGAEGHDELGVEYNGTDLEIGYNSNYIMEIVKQVDTPRVLLEFTNATSAAVVKAESYEENEDYLFLIMPLRLVD